MKKVLSIFLFIVAGCTHGFSQTLSLKANPACGGYFTGGGNSLSWTMGETFYTTLQNGNVILTQGEQQPYISLKILNLRAFIEGCYSAGGTQQPVLLNAGVGSNPLLSDSIIVELHNQLNPSTIAVSKTVALHTDGWAQLTLPAALAGGSYYIAIRTRNAIETWSKLPVTLGANTSFNFTGQ